MWKDFFVSLFKEHQDKVVSFALDKIPFESMTVEKFKGLIEQFHLESFLSESIKQSINDGTISKEEMVSFIKDHVSKRLP